MKYYIQTLLLVFCILIPISSTVYPLNLQTIGEIIKAGEETIFVMLNSDRSTDKINKHYSKVIRLYDQRYGDDKIFGDLVKIALTNPDDDQEVYQTQKLATGFGVDMDYAPYIIFFDIYMDKYRFSGQLTVENLRKFIENVRNKKQKMFWKSQPIPQNDPNCVLKKVVANNFLQQVWQSKQEILLYLYKEDCQQCDRFQATTLKQVVQRTKTSQKIKFLKINTILNELLNMANIRTQPYLMFIHHPKGLPPPYYEGNMKSVDGIITWMKTLSTTGISDPIGEASQNQL